MANALGVDAGSYARGAYRIIIPAINSALESPETGKPTDTGLLKYTGTYTYDPWGGEVAVVPWKEGLAMAYFPDENPPTDLTMLKQVENNRFQRIRDDGEPGEEIEFVLDKTGDVVSIKQHSNYWIKIK